MLSLAQALSPQSASVVLTYLLDDAAAICAASTHHVGRIAKAVESSAADAAPGHSGKATDDASGSKVATGSATWGTAAFREVTAVKLRLLLAELALGLHVLYLDVDVVIFRDLLPGLLALPSRDIYLQ